MPLATTRCHSNHPSHSPRRPLIDGKSGRDIVTELFAETQAQSKKLGNFYADTNPSLNLAIFLKNNNRFIARQGPLIWINENLVKLISWYSVPNTLIFILCYTILCLQPILLALLPQLTLLYLITKFYHYRADAVMTGKPLPMTHDIGTAPKFNPGFQESKLAMQNIQNVMAQVSDVFDLGYNVYKMIDWSNPALTQDVLGVVLLSMIGTLVLVALVPLNIIALVGGVGAFVANTALVKAASVTLAPVFVRNIQDRVNHVKALIANARVSGQDAVIDCVTFENQRWWTGIGWAPALLSTERKAWTDESGAFPQHSKDNYRIPTAQDFTDLDLVAADGPIGVFEWIDDEWNLDFDWSEGDADGWVYFNQMWGQPRASRYMGSFTRRRKWIRHMKMKELI